MGLRSGVVCRPTVVVRCARLTVFPWVVLPDLTASHMALCPAHLNAVDENPVCQCRLTGLLSGSSSSGGQATPTLLSGRCWPGSAHSRREDLRVRQLWKQNRSGQ
jgi:hypothetical protein